MSDQTVAAAATAIQWAYVVTRLDYDHWKDDAKEEHHLMGIFLDLQSANDAAIKHARRVRSRAFPIAGRDPGSSEQSYNSLGAVHLECRTMEDDRDHFTVEVEQYVLDVLDAGFSESEDASDDSKDGEDVSELEQQEDGPPAKKQRT